MSERNGASHRFFNDRISCSTGGWRRAAHVDAAEAGLGGEDVHRLGPPLLVLPAAVDQRQVRDPAGAFAVVELAPRMRADAVPPGLQAVQDDLLAGGLIEQEVTEITEGALSTSTF